MFVSSWFIGTEHLGIILTKRKTIHSWLYFLAYIYNLLQLAKGEQTLMLTLHKNFILKIYYLYPCLCWKSMSDSTVIPRGTLVSLPTPCHRLPCAVLDNHSQLIQFFWPKHIVPEVYAYFSRNHNIWALKSVSVKWDQITCFLVDEIAFCRVKKNKNKAESLKLVRCNLKPKYNSGRIQVHQH